MGLGAFMEGVYGRRLRRAFLGGVLGLGFGSALHTSCLCRQPPPLSSTKKKHQKKPKRKNQERTDRPRLPIYLQSSVTYENTGCSGVPELAFGEPLSRPYRTAPACTEAKDNHNRRLCSPTRHVSTTSVPSSIRRRGQVYHGLSWEPTSAVSISAQAVETIYIG